MSDRFGDYLIEQGLVERTDVMEALEFQAKATAKVGTICLEERWMTVKQVMETLRHTADSERPFEDMAISLGFLTAHQLGHALRIQNERRPFFGEILVTHNILDRRQLFEQLAKFWAHLKKLDDKNNGSKETTETEEQPKGVNYVTVDFPLMYPEEFVEYREEVEHGLQQIALKLTHFRASADLSALASEVAFLANKIRGASDLDGIVWLSEVAGEMEQNMLLIAQNPNHKCVSDTISTFFRGTDSIHHFLDSVQGTQAEADENLLAALRSSKDNFGAIGDMATQKKICNLTGGGIQAPLTRKSLEGARVLLIDDDTVIRNSLERFLRTHKIVVSQAKNGAVGLEHVLQAEKSFDLVIVDLHMPIMDGFEFVEAVKSRPIYDPMPIVMFTASLHMADVQKAMNLGVNGYVIKREWKTNLIPEIEKILGIELGDGPATH